MAPKKKGQKMDLGSFLMDENTGGSWADEMEALPTGPSGEPGFGPGSGGLGGSHLSRGQDRYGDRQGGGPGGFGDRAARPEIPIPDEPPFTAFAGNLSFETTEGDLEDFFAPLKVTSVRLVMGPDARPKGFGYVEFDSQSDLKEALAKTGADVNGRSIRIGVAEPPRQREGRADDEPTWERKGPLPPPERRSGGFGSGGGGFGGASAAGGPRRSDFDMPPVEREGPIRGGKFVPSADVPAPRRSGFGDRSFSSGGAGAAGGFSGAPEVEREGPIRGGKFVPSTQPVDGPGGSRSTSFGGSRKPSLNEPSRADEAGWQRSGPLQQPSASSSSSPSGAPTERRKLQLSARSVNADSSSSNATNGSGDSTSSSKPSPFGAAKPINTADREREIEEKLEKEREAARAAAKPAGAGATDGTTIVLTKDKASPFGGAKPINSAAREREVEDKLVQSSARPKRDHANASLRKEGFSYAAAGGSAPAAAAGAGRRPSASSPPPATATSPKMTGTNGSSTDEPTSPKQKENKSLISALEETTI